MGDPESRPQASGLTQEGSSLFSAAFSSSTLNDDDWWTKAEAWTAGLISNIQPTGPSEERRQAVADYVQGLVHKCFDCQVLPFGSVPLKTYLPDGDIDLVAFSRNLEVKDSWAQDVRNVLEKAEQNSYSEFRVKEVQYIHAEVKLIKCLVENIVVDISFNQLGGLCTLCFLEEVDRAIAHNHLFKRSIILVKAWCYYESRILGAHHGLISSYALETLVLYIFHVFHCSLRGPLEVLYRFLQFFSNFDWDKYCVSLWGPVPLSTLPEVAAQPPRRDGGELLLTKAFIDACSETYAVIPAGQDAQARTFAVKFLNVIDPLRTSNNLGRSVSKGNFIRIRSAFGYGARKLAGILQCPKENIGRELDIFFTNTQRHGSDRRPDAPDPASQQPQTRNAAGAAIRHKDLVFTGNKQEKVESSLYSGLAESYHANSPRSNFLLPGWPIGALRQQVPIDQIEWMKYVTSKQGDPAVGTRSSTPVAEPSSMKGNSTDSGTIPNAAGSSLNRKFENLQASEPGPSRTAPNSLRSEGLSRQPETRVVFTNAEAEGRAKVLNRRSNLDNGNPGSPGVDSRNAQDLREPTSSYLDMSEPRESFMQQGFPMEELASRPGAFLAKSRNNTGANPNFVTYYSGEGSQAPAEAAAAASQGIVQHGRSQTEDYIESPASSRKSSLMSGTEEEIAPHGNWMSEQSRCGESAGSFDPGRQGSSQDPSSETVSRPLHTPLRHPV